jgi:hypothetical protein
VSIRIKAERAGWAVRECAWGVEDRLADAADDAAQAIEPLQRLIDTKLASPAGRAIRERIQPWQYRFETRVAWPLADALRRRGTNARAAIATGAVAAVAGAATIGTIAGSGPDSEEGSAAVAGPMPAVLASADAPELKGVAPEFESDEGASAQPAQSESPERRTPPPAAPPPDANPAEVARSFADAFVRYEVGELTPRTSAVIAEVAEKPLAKALATEPPRLPAAADVPKADVLNVVMGERDDEKAEASVSLVRLDAASELRLMLEHTDEGWRVTQVLG